mmetsp:Transcript_100322/g.259463  ORF Transcript_100322/g.259463 Transcript_100322/m.259463 type:complete len:237 (-) Transcript_100322:1258-1968(-)
MTRMKTRTKMATVRPLPMHGQVPRLRPHWWQRRWGPPLLAPMQPVPHRQPRRPLEGLEAATGRATSETVPPQAPPMPAQAHHRNHRRTSRDQQPVLPQRWPCWRVCFPVAAGRLPRQHFSLCLVDQLEVPRRSSRTRRTLRCSTSRRRPLHRLMNCQRGLRHRRHCHRDRPRPGDHCWLQMSRLQAQRRAPLQPTTSLDAWEAMAVRAAPLLLGSGRPPAPACPRCSCRGSARSRG